MKRKISLLPLCLLLFVLAISACTSLDCPLNNTVRVHFVLAGEVETLSDTLTVSVTRADGTDTIVYNKGVNLTNFSIPLSYTQETDRLKLLFKAEDGRVWNDIITITKTNEPHFEAVDCHPAYFHQLTAVSSTNNYIDNIVINHPQVDYDVTQEHIYLYLRAHD